MLLQLATSSSGSRNLFVGSTVFDYYYSDENTVPVMASAFIQVVRAATVGETIIRYHVVNGQDITQYVAYDYEAFPSGAAIVQFMTKPFLVSPDFDVRIRLFSDNPADTSRTVNVTLYDTSVRNDITGASVVATNMRGTDNALLASNYVVPPTASANANAMVAIGYTSGRAVRLDNLDATISSRLSYQQWAELVGIRPPKQFVNDGTLQFSNLVIGTYYFTVPTIGSVSASTSVVAGDYFLSPSALSTLVAGHYRVTVRLRAGGSPANTDLVIGQIDADWSGTTWSNWTLAQSLFNVRNDITDGFTDVGPVVVDNIINAVTPTTNLWNASSVGGRLNASINAVGGDVTDIQEELLPDIANTLSNMDNSLGLAATASVAANNKLPADTTTRLNRLDVAVGTRASDSSLASVSTQVGNINQRLPNIGGDSRIG